MKKLLLLFTLILSVFLVSSCKKDDPKQPDKPDQTLDLSKLAVPSGRVLKNFTLPAKLKETEIKYEITQGKEAATLNNLEVQVFRQDKDVSVTLLATAGELTHEFNFTVAKLEGAQITQYKALESTLKKAEFTAKAKEIYEKVPVLSTIIKLVEAQIAKFGLDKLNQTGASDDSVFSKIIAQFKDKDGKLVFPEKLEVENPGLLKNYIDLYNTIRQALKQPFPKTNTETLKKVGAKLAALLNAESIAKLVEDNFIFKKAGKEDKEYKKQVLDFIRSELNQKSIQMLIDQALNLFPKLPDLGSWKELTEFFPTLFDLGKAIYDLKLQQNKLSALKDKISAGKVVQQSEVDTEIATFKAHQAALNKAVQAVESQLNKDNIQAAFKDALNSVGKFFKHFAPEDLSKLSSARKAEVFKKYQEQVKAFTNIHEFILGLVLRLGNKNYEHELMPGGDADLFSLVSAWSKYLVGFISKDNTNIHPAISSVFSILYGQVFGAKTGTVENCKQLFQIAKYFLDPQNGQDSKVYSDLVKLIQELKVMSLR